MAPGKILIIGGYGQVGRMISTKLADQFPGDVIAAGRNIRKAESLSQVTGGKVLPLAFDLFAPKVNFAKVLEGVSLVIMCLDQPDTRLVEQIILQGIDYMDITAASEFLAAVENLDDCAKASGSTVALSVGLEPGLTNLLAADAKNTLDEADKVHPIKHLDIFVLLGMGDAHGDAAIHWMLDHILAEFTVLEHGQEKKVRSFEDGKPTCFPGIGRRTAYRFNFPDQHSLPKTQEINSVSSRFCFDQEIVTRSMALLKRIGLLHSLQSPRVKGAVVQGMKKLRFGSDQFALKTEALGKKNGAEVKLSSTIRGANEARLTGLVTAEVAQRLYSNPHPSGIFHIDQLFTLRPLIDPLIVDGLLEFTQELS